MGKTTSALIFLLLLLPFNFCFGENASDVLDINANYMELVEQRQLIVFTGDVVAKKGKMTMYASKLEVSYSENPTTKQKDITSMLATGTVKVVQENRIATGNIARYYKDKDMMVLEGNPATIREKNENLVTGNKITFYMKDNKSTVEGNRPRVIFKTGQ